MMALDQNQETENTIPVRLKSILGCGYFTELHKEAQRAQRNAARVTATLIFKLLHDTVPVKLADRDLMRVDLDLFAVERLYFCF